MFPEPTKLSDRIHLDPKIQIKCVDTKHQLADMLTKGNFTRDEWNNLVFLLNISHFSSLCCAQNFSLTSCNRTMAKRMQEKKGDNRIVANSEPTTMNLVSTSSSNVNSPIASKSPGILKAPCRKAWSSTGKPDARDRNHDAASNSQGCQEDALLLDGCTGKPVATEEDQEHQNYPDEFVGTGKPVAQDTKDIQDPKETQETQEPEGNDKVCPHHLHISPNYVQHMEKVFSIVRQTYGRCSTDPMKDVDVSTAFWVYIYVCHSSSCSLSWERLHGNSTTYQESTLEIGENNGFK